MRNESATESTNPEVPSAAVVDASLEATTSLGAWFAENRIRYHLTPEEAARALMLNPSIVRALEADDFARLGPTVFVRGYLTRYARLLDMPDHEVLERFREQTRGHQELPALHVPSPLQRETQTRDLYGLVYLVLVVGIGWAAIQHLPELDHLLGTWSGATAEHSAPANNNNQVVHYPFQEPGTPAAQLATPAVPALAPLPAPTLTNTAVPNGASVVFTTETSPKPLLTNTPNAAVATTSFSVKASEASAPDANGEAKLMLEFSNDCWVEIKDAQGNLLTSGMMRANTTHSLSGPVPFKVTLGNAPAARIILDDRLVDTNIYLPRRGTVSRFTLDRE